MSTNTVARAVLSFGQYWLWLAAWLSNDKNFFVTLALTCDEQMLKISRRYLDSYLSNGWLTEKLLQQMAQDWSLFAILPKSDQSWAICYNKFSVKGQLLNQDIFLKFSAFVHHISTLNWQKKIFPIAQSGCWPQPISSKT